MIKKKDQYSKGQEILYLFGSNDAVLLSHIKKNNELLKIRAPSWGGSKGRAKGAKRSSKRRPLEVPKASPRAPKGVLGVPRELPRAPLELPELQKREKVEDKSERD